MFEDLPFNLLLNPIEAQLAGLLHHLAGLVVMDHVGLDAVTEIAAPGRGGCGHRGCGSRRRIRDVGDQCDLIQRAARRNQPTKHPTLCAIANIDLPPISGLVLTENQVRPTGYDLPSAWVVGARTLAHVDDLRACQRRDFWRWRRHRRGSRDRRGRRHRHGNHVPRAGRLAVPQAGDLHNLGLDANVTIAGRRLEGVDRIVDWIGDLLQYRAIGPENRIGDLQPGGAGIDVSPGLELARDLPQVRVNVPTVGVAYHHLGDAVQVQQSQLVGKAAAVLDRYSPLHLLVVDVAVHISADGAVIGQWLGDAGVLNRKLNGLTGLDNAVLSAKADLGDKRLEHLSEAFQPQLAFAALDRHARQLQLHLAAVDLVGRKGQQRAQRASHLIGRRVCRARDQDAVGDAAKSLPVVAARIPVNR